jgi:hypothetical protein
VRRHLKEKKSKDREEDMSVKKNKKFAVLVDKN